MVSDHAFISQAVFDGRISEYGAQTLAAAAIAAEDGNPVSVVYGPRLAEVMSHTGPRPVLALARACLEAVPGPLHWVVDKPIGATWHLDADPDYAQQVIASLVQAKHAAGVGALVVPHELLAAVQQSNSTLSETLAALKSVAPKPKREPSYRVLADRLLHRTPGLAEVVACPVLICGRPPLTVWSMIQHINDQHLGWSRQDIADWLDSTGIDLTVQPHDQRRPRAHAPDAAGPLTAGPFTIVGPAPADYTPGQEPTFALGDVAGNPLAAANHPHVTDASMTFTPQAAKIRISLQCGTTLDLTFPSSQYLAWPDVHPNELSHLIRAHIDVHLAGSCPQAHPGNTTTKEES